MYRLVYWSRSTISPSDEAIKLREILTEAIHFNQQHDITGVLYFGHGYFMQCLEGPQEAIDFIYEKIKCDPRHTEVTTMLTGKLGRRLFQRWQMSYIRQKSMEIAFLKHLGYDQFQPDQLTKTQLMLFLEYLHDESVLRTMLQKENSN